MNQFWLFLFAAGLFEIGWPLGLKLSDVSGMKWWGIGMAVVSMSASGLLLWLSLKDIPIGTAYAVWTGIGALGAFAVGILFLGEAVTPLRLLAALLIVSGLALMKLTSS